MEKYFILLAVLFVLTAFYSTYEQYQTKIKVSPVGFKLKLLALLLTFVFAVVISPLSLIEYAIKGWKLNFNKKEVHK